MRSITLTRSGMAVFAAAGIVWLIWQSTNFAADSGADAPKPPPTAETSSEVAALKADVERLKGMLPDQAHAMKDVGYHFANLWFAAQHKNWPLAEFYWAETRSHLRWAVRIIPVRKAPQGQDIRLTDILDPIEQTALEEVHKTIREQSGEQFPKAYQQMLESCYGCHVAVGKPFLRLQIPRQPEVPIIRFEPEP
jgi:hypothetical protein